MAAHLFSLTTAFCFVFLLLAAAALDIREYRIPNSIVVALVVLYPVHFLASPLPIDWMGGLGVAAACFAVGILLFNFGVAGGGDVKLLAAVALWAGPGMVLDFLFVTAIIGGMLGLTMVIGPIRSALSRIGGRKVAELLGGKAMPYGLAIAGGGLMVAWRLGMAAIASG